MTDQHIPTPKYDAVVRKLREFCHSKGLLEVHTQSHRTILAACENPFSVRDFEWYGEKFAMPQTGQMELEKEMLENPDAAKGYFCVTTSYRHERKEDIVPGRHQTMFPMFEFEIPGDMNDLIQFQKELLLHLGYDESMFVEREYRDLLAEYGVKEITSKEEAVMGKEISPVVFLKNFDNYSSPFWNMKQHEDGNGAYKVDVILDGHETIGSAERSCSTEEMRTQFDTIMEGRYKDKLYEIFGKEPVEKEMDEFLSYKFFPRSGGGIGLHRLVRSLELRGLL